MVNCDKLLQHCPFEIRKVVKNTKNLILNRKIMLLSNSKNESCLIYGKYKNVLFLNTKNVLFLNTIKCIAFKYEECLIVNTKNVLCSNTKMLYF